MDQKQYLHEVGQNLADLFYNQKNINMKQETLEEAAEKRIPTSTSIWDLTETRRSDFKAGAKWQQQQMEKLKDFDTWKEWVNEKS